MKLFIADDNIPYRQRLATVLADIEGIEIAGVADTVSGAISSIGTVRPDAVILDIHMKDGSGFDILHAVRSMLSVPVVIMLTVGPRNEYQASSYAAGADYFFDKAGDIKKLIRVLRHLVKIQHAK
ncbi:MAG: response regulator transcription factor [Acidobacteriota bacterium]